MNVRSAHWRNISVHTADLVKANAVYAHLLVAEHLKPFYPFCFKGSAGNSFALSLYRITRGPWLPHV